MRAYIHFFLPVYATKQDTWIYMYIRIFQDVDNWLIQRDIIYFSLINIIINLLLLINKFYLTNSY